MRHPLNRTLLIGALALAAQTALADRSPGDLSYDYIEPRYAKTELDNDGFGDDIEGDGYVLNGSLSFSDNIHLFVGYDKLEFDDDVTLRTRLIGGGLALPVSNRADIVVRGGFVEAEFNTPFFSDEDDGTFASIGARFLVADDIELYGDFRRLNLDLADDEDSTTVGLEFYLNDGFSIGPSVTWIDDVTTWTLGGRVYF